MKVALCCIGRMENQYAVEFVEWYKGLGFDKIFIYDNNHDGEEHFEDVLQGYIDDGLVKIVNCRNVAVAQTKAYSHCYNTYGREYDWMMFFDFDEFLELKKCKTIQEYFSQDIFSDFECIKINWMLYGDNDIVLNDGRPLNERFTKPLDYDLKTLHSFPENNNTKSCIRCGLGNIIFGVNPHIPLNHLKMCNADGNISDYSQFHNYSFENAYLKHFNTKTIEEWIKNKLKKGTADRTYERFLKTTEYQVDYFFKYNKKTDEKVRYLNEVL